MQQATSSSPCELSSPALVINYSLLSLLIYSITYTQTWYGCPLPEAAHYWPEYHIVHPSQALDNSKAISSYLDFLICNEPQVQDVCQRGRVGPHSPLESHIKRCKWQWRVWIHVAVASQSEGCTSCWGSSHHTFACKYAIIMISSLVLCANQYCHSRLW